MPPVNKDGDNVQPAIKPTVSGFIRPLIKQPAAAPNNAILNLTNLILLASFAAAVLSKTLVTMPDMKKIYNNNIIIFSYYTSVSQVVV